MTAVAVAPRSGIQGITWRKSQNKWAVRAYRGPFSYWLGTFDTLREASDVLDAWHAGNPAQPVSKPTKRPPSNIVLTLEQVAYAMSIAPQIRGF